MWPESLLAILCLPNYPTIFAVVYRKIGPSQLINRLFHKSFTSQSWKPLDQGERVAVEQRINNDQVEAMRRLVPDSGAYLNEAYWNDPNFQKAFWGSNYDRLRSIKKAVDPEDIFWCRTCVGSEGWAEKEDLLCKVSEKLR